MSFATDLLSTSVPCPRSSGSGSLGCHHQPVAADASSPLLDHGGDLTWHQRSCHGVALVM